MKAVMSLYEDTKAKVKVGTIHSDEFSVKVGVHQGSVLSPLLFAFLIDVVTEGVKEGLLEGILYADDLLLMAETIQDVCRKFYKWKNDSKEKE